MKLECEDFKDIVVFDVVSFADYSEGKDDILGWCSIIKYGTNTDLFSLFDSDQIIGFPDSKSYVGFVCLENNKLLTIRVDQPTPGDRDIPYYFTLRPFCDTYSLDIKDSKKAVLECSSEEFKPMEYEVYKILYDGELPLGKTLIKDLLKPVSFNQLYERGLKNKDKTGTR